jgi:hypothetical protein
MFCAMGKAKIMVVASCGIRDKPPFPVLLGAFAVDSRPCNFLKSIRGRIFPAGWGSVPMGSLPDIF